MATNEERIGVLEARMSAMELDVRETSKDVKLLLALENRRKGGWAVIAAASAVAGAMGSIVTWFAGKGG